MMRTWGFALLCLACTPTPSPERPTTPGGLEVELRSGAVWSEERAAILDEMHAAVVRCMRPEEFTRRDPPRVIVVGDCQHFDLSGYGPVAGYAPWWRGEVWVSGSLWAFPHEIAWHYYPERSKPEPVKGEDLCGDVLGRTFRDRLPARGCDR